MRKETRKEAVQRLKEEINQKVRDVDYSLDKLACYTYDRRYKDGGTKNNMIVEAHKHLYAILDTVNKINK